MTECLRSISTSWLQGEGQGSRDQLAHSLPLNSPEFRAAFAPCLNSGEFSYKHFVAGWSLLDRGADQQWYRRWQRRPRTSHVNLREFDHFAVDPLMTCTSTTYTTRSTSTVRRNRAE